MKESSIYYVTRARTIAGKLPQRQELNYMAQTMEEGPFVERVQKRLGMQYSTQDIVSYFREFTGRVALDFSKEGKTGKAFLMAVLLENIKLAVLSKLSGTASAYYTAYGSTLGEDFIRRLLSAEDLQRARLGNEMIERHVRAAHAIYRSFDSPELVVHYFDGAEIRELRAVSRATGVNFEALAFDVSVCAFVEPLSQDAAKALYIFGKPRCGDFQEGVELLKRQVGIQTQERDPEKALLELKQAVHLRSLSEFSNNNIVDLYFMLKLTEKDLERIKKYYINHESLLVS